MYIGKVGKGWITLLSLRKSKKAREVDGQIIGVNKQDLINRSVWESCGRKEGEVNGQMVGSRVFRSQKSSLGNICFQIIYPPVNLPTPSFMSYQIIEKPQPTMGKYTRLLTSGCEC